MWRVAEGERERESLNNQYPVDGRQRELTAYPVPARHFAIVLNVTHRLPH